eukprot:sb/3472718/
MTGNQPIRDQYFLIILLTISLSASIYLFCSKSGRGEGGSNKTTTYRPSQIICRDFISFRPRRTKGKHVYLLSNSPNVCTLIQQLGTLHMKAPRLAPRPLFELVGTFIVGPFTPSENNGSISIKKTFFKVRVNRIRIGQVFEIRNRPNQEIPVPDLLITSHVT